jgi:Flp pilus assembly secretin CpaC
MSVRLSNFRPKRRAISRFMRQLAATSVISALVAAAVASGACVVRADETLTVTVDEARVVKVPAGTKTLVIGNPMIADVTLLKSGQTMIVTGKGFGETNFIALDGDGKPVAQSQIRVVSGANALIVQRGMDRQSYTCAPRCQPSARLGDDPGYFNDVAGQIQAHNSQATK